MLGGVRMALLSGGGVAAALVNYTNIALQSQTFNSATWSKLNATVTADSAAAPDATATADLITESSDATAKEHTPFQNITLAASTVYTESIYAKKVNRNLKLRFDHGGEHSAVFDLTAGTVGTLTNATATITDAGGGYWRCTITFTSGVSAGSGQLYAEGHNGTTANYVGSGLGMFYLWQAQLVAASLPGPVILTTTTSASGLG